MNFQLCHQVQELAVTKFTVPNVNLTDKYWQQFGQQFPVKIKSKCNFYRISLFILVLFLHLSVNFTVRIIKNKVFIDGRDC